MEPSVRPGSPPAGCRVAWEPLATIRDATDHRNPGSERQSIRAPEAYRIPHVSLGDTAAPRPSASKRLLCMQIVWGPMLGGPLVQ